MRRASLLLLLILGCAHIPPAAPPTISQDEGARLMESHRAYWIFGASDPVNGLVVEYEPGQTFLYKKAPSDTAYLLVRRVPDFIRNGEMGETFEEASGYRNEIQALTE